MKKAITFMLATVLTFGGVCANTVPAYAEQASVKIILDGQTLTVPSDMPQPQIINGRTMLPLRYTASVLGFDVAFDTATSTAIMTKDNVILKHKMFTDTVTVNGVEKRYEVASQNQNDYMIMPLAMFLDATDTEGEWNGVTRTVTIDTEVFPHVLSINIPDAPPVIRVGGAVTVAVIAGKAATHVQLVEDNMTVVTQSSTFITNNDGTKTFVMTWKPENSGTTGFRVLKAVAGSAGGISSRAETKEVSILVEGLPIVAPEINSMSLQNSVITAGSNARLIIYTTDAVERVRVTNNQNGSVEEVTQYTTTSKERRFEVSTRLLRTGSVRLTAEVAGEDGIYTDSHYTSVTVRNLSPYADDEVQVIQVSTSPKRARPNSNVIVSVLTTNAANSVSIIEEGTNEVKAGKSSPDSSRDRKSTRLNSSH